MLLMLDCLAEYRILGWKLLFLSFEGTVSIEKPDDVLVFDLLYVTCCFSLPKCVWKPFLYLCYSEYPSDVS